jgi:hypothetical protein
MKHCSDSLSCTYEGAKTVKNTVNARPASATFNVEILETDPAHVVTNHNLQNHIGKIAGHY